MLEGIPGSPGLALGAAIVLDRRTGVVRRHVPNHQIDEEVERFDAPSSSPPRASPRLPSARARSRAESSILEAYVMMVKDETLHDEVERRIRIDRLCAEWALTVAIDEMAGQLVAGGGLLPRRAQPRHSVRRPEHSARPRRTSRTGGAAPGGREPAVLVAHDLSPAETATLNKDNVLAIVTEVGTRTSHTAILARALEIPAVVGAAGALARIGDGDSCSSTACAGA